MASDITTKGLAKISINDLFDGSDAHELCSACGGSGRAYEGERCRFCADIKPVTNRHISKDDCDELREIADWLDSLGKRKNADFLRGFANRIEGGDDMSPSNL